MSDRAAVYRFYDVNDVLLYVGATKDFEQRRATHARTAKWWGEVARHEVEWHATRLDALVAEATLIRDLRPLHNIQTPSPDDLDALLGAASSGRPATGQIPLQHTRIDQDDWDDLEAAAGRQRAKIVRDLIRWYLRRPGATLPERPSREEMNEIARARLLDSE